MHLIIFILFPGAVLSLRGLVERENTHFHLSNGEGCLHQMGNFVMAESDF